MKILYLTPYNPVPPTFGGAIRIYYILKHLTTHYDVTVAGYGTPDERKEMEKHFPELTGKVHFIKGEISKTYRWTKFLRSIVSGKSHWQCLTVIPEMKALLEWLVESYDFDIIQCEFPAMAFFDLKTNALRVLDAHNVEYDNLRRMAAGDISFFQKLYYNMEAKKMYREETDVATRQDAILACSKRDIHLFDKDLPSVPKYLIPNGVDLTHFQRDETVPEPDTLVFVGMMRYLPNEDAMNFFLNEVFPKIRERVPRAKITIVGSQPSSTLLERRNKHIEVTGFVDDVRSFINRSSVYVVPLRMGGGTRLKILEAMAMNIPIVSTSIGCEGIDLVHGKTALIADEAESFADAVVELLQNRQLRDSLARSAYELVEQTYSWQKIGLRIEEAYSDALEKKKGLLETV